ncbi:retrovirus-related pol polyprotein from transposon TNT 1-94 [Tanacetum coccineum]
MVIGIEGLSHLNFDYSKPALQRKNIVIGLPKLKYVRDHLCSSCEVSKAKRSSFKSKTVPSSKGRFESCLPHDLCGPNAGSSIIMRVASINGKRYILLIIDDYSRYTWTLFLHSKDETPEVLKSKGYRVYNKRTRLIVESIHLRFDEIKEMSETSVANDTSGLVPQRQKASDYDNPDPAPELQNVSPSADTTVPSQQELDLLFGPLYDEFFNDGTSRVNKSSSPTDNSAPQDTHPSTNIHPTSEPSTPTNVHAEENNDNQAEFTNPFCTPVQEIAESSSRNIGNSNVHTFNQPQDSEYRWTKDHPLTQVRGNPSKPVQTRRQLATYPEMCMFALTVSIVEPKNIKEAMADSAWIEAMQEELHQFDRLQVWELVDKPFGKNVIKLKWLWKNKKDEDQTVIRNKARLVAKGYAQEEDGRETAFLNGPLKGGGKLYRDLKQAPRAWYDELSKFLISNGFTKGIIDPTLFTIKYGEDILLVQIYVDDIIFGSTNPKFSKRFEKLMHGRFEMSLMGEMKFFLGLQIHQSPRGIFINQAKYTLEILKKHGMEKGQSIGTPMATKPKLDADLSGEPVDQTDYRSKIGSLMYLTSSRPDIVQAVCYCARYQARPTEKHLKEVKRIFRYLRGDKLVSWMSKKQDCTAMSSAEAEYVALSASCAQVMWMRTQLKDYGFNYNKIPLYCDSQSAIAISCNQCSTPVPAILTRGKVRNLSYDPTEPDEIHPRTLHSLENPPAVLRVKIKKKRIHKDGDGDASFQLKSDSLPHAHAHSTKTYYKHQDSRIMKAQELKTKTSAQTLIYKIFLQRY